MEADKKRHIENHLWDLIRLTKCNVTCTSVLRTHGVLEQEDIEELYASILNPIIIAEFTHLPWRIVDVLNITKRFDESENMGNEMLQLLAKFIPLDDPDLCRLKYQLAVAALTRGQEHEELLKRNLEILQTLKIKYVENKSVFSASETLALEGLLVEYLHEFKQYKEALALAHKTFAQQKELNGLNHWQTIDALVRVGNSFYGLIFSESIPNPPGAEAMEQLKPIVSLLKDAHEGNLELIGKDINWTNSIYNLMESLANIGECEFAAKIVNDVIERTNNGDCNGDKRYARVVIKCLDTLACMKTYEGTLEEALTIYENVHSKYASLKGHNDGETLSAKLNVILKLVELEKLEEALDCYKNVLESLEKYYPNNMQVIDVQTSMVLVLAKMGRLKESWELLNDCEEQSTNKFGHDHPIVKRLKSHPFKSRLESCVKKQDKLENSEKVD
ncbi:unnamed protein product [Orchesella dallaii]|uniref:Kinesin light chain n=1 Tax=Orchesella dallaii TaxID=48710 RepID=A0ABP1RHV7_9HEXA